MYQRYGVKWAQTGCKSMQETRFSALPKSVCTCLLTCLVRISEEGGKFLCVTNFLGHRKTSGIDRKERRGSRKSRRDGKNLRTVINDRKQSF